MLFPNHCPYLDACVDITAGFPMRDDASRLFVAWFSTNLMYTITNHGARYSKNPRPSLLDVIRHPRWLCCHGHPGRNEYSQLHYLESWRQLSEGPANCQQCTFMFLSASRKCQVPVRRLITFDPWALLRQDIPTGPILGLHPTNQRTSLQSNTVSHWLGANL